MKLFFNPSKRLTAAKTRTAHMCLVLKIVGLLSMIASPSVAAVSPSPVRQVISMLQMMRSKVEQEGRNQEVIFDKYICYCQTSLAKINTDIISGKDAVPQLESSLKEGTAAKGSLDNEIIEAKAELAEAEKTLAEATSLRAKENTDFRAEDSRMKVDIQGLKKAVKAMDALDDGESYLQADMISTIRRLAATSAALRSSDRDVITNFLSTSENHQESDQESDQESALDGLSQSSPQEISGILKQMLESLTKDKVQLDEDEQNSLQQFESLKSAKDVEIASLKSESATKTERASQIGLQLVEDAGKLDDAKTALDKNLMLNEELSKECQRRHAEFDKEKQTNSEELAAISDTMKILNDEVASQLFRTTMTSGVATSFLQLKASPDQLRADALAALQNTLPGLKKDRHIDFVTLALRSKKSNFSKVLQLIQDMIALLKKEQKDDEEKKQYCENEISKTMDEKKDVEQAISDLNKGMDQVTQTSNILAADIKAKGDGIIALDKLVSEATKQRKEEHADYMGSLQANSAAKEILTIAKARLAKFYDGQVAKLLQTHERPKLAKNQVVGKALRIKAFRAAKSDEAFTAGLSDSGKSSLSTLFEDSKGALSFVQEGIEFSHAKQAKEESNAVIKLIDKIITDMGKDMAEMSTNEKEAQFEFESATREFATKRALAAKDITKLVGYKAEIEADHHKKAGAVESKTAESAGKSHYLDSLRNECDFLMEHFETRASARTSEIEALQKATAVLTEADTAFLQVAMKVMRGLRSAK